MKTKQVATPTRDTLWGVNICILSPQVDHEYDETDHGISAYVEFKGEEGRPYTPSVVVTDVHGREQGFIGPLIGKWGSGIWGFRLPLLDSGEYYFLFRLEAGRKKTPTHVVRFYVTKLKAVETKGGGV
jgi:hypothetical protein